MYYGRPCVERGTFDPRDLLQFNGWRLLEANIFATEDYFQTTIYIGGYTPHPVHVQVAVSSTDRHFKKHKGFGILWFTVDLNTGSTFLDTQDVETIMMVILDMEKSFIEKKIPFVDWYRFHDDLTLNHAYNLDMRDQNRKLREELGMKSLEGTAYNRQLNTQNGNSTSD